MGEEVIQPVMDDLFESGKNRAFVPFKGSPNLPVMAVGKKDMDELPVPGLSLCTPGIKDSREVINPIGSSFSRSSSSPASPNLQSNFKAAGQQQSARKQRRCWSPELHRQFINALQHLGGPQGLKLAKLVFSLKCAELLLSLVEFMVIDEQSVCKFWYNQFGSAFIRRNLLAKPKNFCWIFLIW